MPAKLVLSDEESKKTFIFAWNKVTLQLVKIELKSRFIYLK